MPRKDGTGPMGSGSKSGKGLGNCTNASIQKSDVGVKVEAGFGTKRGLGRGAGRRQNTNKNTSKL